MADPTETALQQAFERACKSLVAIGEREGPGRGVHSVEASLRDRAPFRETLTEVAAPPDLRSVSKVLVALAIGAAIDRSISLRGVPLSLDTTVAPFFAEYVAKMPAETAARFRRVRVRNLMSNTIGHRDGFLFRKDVSLQDEDNLLDYIFAQPLAFEPGEHFSYSNVGWYLLAAMITRETGETLSAWARDYVLQPLGISDAVFKRYGRYEIAASGVCMDNPDLHRVARLLADRGEHGGREVLSSRWVSEMMSDLYVTDADQDPARILQYRSYGLGMWASADGWHYCDGSAGQLLAIKPDCGLAVTAVGDSSSVTEVVNALQPLLDL